MRVRSAGALKLVLEHGWVMSVEGCVHFPEQLRSSEEASSLDVSSHSEDDGNDGNVDIIASRSRFP